MDWIVLDGPIDTCWVESLNSVLDDSRRLCLNSGSVLILTQQIRLIFETEDLLAATPATISRCGMLYIAPDVTGPQMLVDAWLARLPDNFKASQLNFRRLRYLFSEFLHPALIFLAEQTGFFLDHSSSEEEETRFSKNSIHPSLGNN